jgi:hypothetical protein
MRGVDYSKVQAMLDQSQPATFEALVQDRILPRLGELWVEAYSAGAHAAEIVEVQVDSFSYLFDLTRQRCIAAYGFMHGKHTGARDSSRMAGFPKAEGKDYHRGHMIPHTGHGGTDINLFIQLGSVNIGPFRELERAAVAESGAFYFVHLLYAPGARHERPTAVEQGLARKGPPPGLELRFHPN